jgi:mannose-6-phosphate isomerase-like protein (cupin superfamily)
MTESNDDRVTVCRATDARPLMEGGELALVYFMSDRLVFSSSILPVGQKSSRDSGHPGAHEVVYCVKGEVVIELSDNLGHFVRLKKGDAALIGDGVPHTAYNAGSKAAKLIWCAAPSLGRPLVE